VSVRQFLSWLGNGFKHLPTDDWQPGDLAECMESRWLIIATGMKCDGPRMGQILRVDAVDEVDGLVGLSFEGLDFWWAAACFRKVKPRQTEACDKWFKKQLQNMRPTVDA
jgi:hypothetical protein